MKIRNKEIVVGIIGNPNSGKTTIFNALTGARHKVANWSGVTVEKREGFINMGDYRIKIVDLPGIYSLTSYSIEEIVTRDFILNEYPDLIIDVVDAGNLERNLYLTTQLIEMGAKVVVALNMFDEATSKGLAIDVDKLEKLLGMPVVKTIGTRSIGIDEIKKEIIDVSEGRSEKIRHIHVQYGSKANGLSTFLQYSHPTISPIEYPLYPFQYPIRTEREYALSSHSFPRKHQ